MVMRSEKVPESPSSALQTMYFCAACCARHRLPLDTRRKRRTAAPAQARVDQRLHDGFGGQGDGIAQAVKAAIGLVVGQ
jgi:hypothetical protein